MYTYKTKDGSDCFVTGVGKTVNGTITTPIQIENPNFELVDGGDSQAPIVGTASQINPALGPTAEDTANKEN